jgi:TrmH family RNA methyltransferase
MGLSKNRIKYLNALKIKKYRQQYRQFIMEGDKMVADLLREGTVPVRQLIATEDWLAETNVSLLRLVEEVVIADRRELERISSLETPPPAIAVLDLHDEPPDTGVLSEMLSLGVDTIQDPGNLGTIIRTADWFGITHVVCSDGCADCYNPKSIQASMGAVLRVHVSYCNMEELIPELFSRGNFPVIGTFMDGNPVYTVSRPDRGMLLFGNESRGISNKLGKFVTQRITIPPGEGRQHVESLNVASAVAVVCSWLMRP